MVLEKQTNEEKDKIMTGFMIDVVKQVLDGNIFEFNSKLWQQQWVPKWVPHISVCLCVGLENIFYNRRQSKDLVLNPTCGVNALTTFSSF